MGYSIAMVGRYSQICDKALRKFRSYFGRIFLEKIDLNLKY